MKVTSIESWLVEVPQTPPIAPYQSRYQAGTTADAVIFTTGSRTTSRSSPSPSSADACACRRGPVWESRSISRR